MDATNSTNNPAGPTGESPTDSHSSYVANYSGSHPNLALAGLNNYHSHDSSQVHHHQSKKPTILQQADRRLSGPSSQQQRQTASSSASNNYKSHKVILPLQPPDQVTKSEPFLLPAPPPPLPPTSSDPDQSKFQYILVAQTSNATKLNEPSITYLNQSQAYELRMKKVGDLSHLSNRLLLSKVRICFHERRLQYMELEQMVEWSAKHPRERALDLDIPLSYGVIDPSIPSCHETSQINSISFR